MRYQMKLKLTHDEVRVSDAKAESEEAEGTESAENTTDSEAKTVNAEADEEENAQDTEEDKESEVQSYDREVFVIINLKSNGQIINLNVCSIGTLNASLVSSRKIMKAAILSNASAFIAVHNHHSGNCSPSSEDIETTKRLAECGEILDIRMLDHIIVA